jgi:hypothetical protein
MRFAFFQLYSKSEMAITKALNSQRSEVPLSDLSSSFSAGTGYGLMQAIIVFGSVVENAFGNGTYYTSQCTSLSLFTLTALTTCFVSMMQVAWMIIGFNAYRNKSPFRLLLLLVLHLGSSMTSLLNQQQDMCLVNIGVQCLIMFLSIVVAFWSEKNAIVKLGIVPAGDNNNRR